MTKRVSAHGGHSGEFCTHAKDRLADIVAEYFRQGFDWIGLSEHMPPLSDDFRYDDERDAGQSAEFLQNRFDNYFRTARQLQSEYAKKLKIFVGFETETYTGASQEIARLKKKYSPDFVVGSLHHVNDLEIDFSAEKYARAVTQLGGIENLYCRYFDQQFEMISLTKPEIVGHLDLIRIFDPNYTTTLALPSVWERIERNLAAIKELGLSLDLNLAGIKKGRELYPSEPILKRAIELGIYLTPGDDSHSVSTVGQYYDQAMKSLLELGA
ncbi:MAG: histidinol-phosphatase HisJ, partial [Bdellovibrionales bacterium]|nr:histidinol-phosphatase HisJ [Bdellovibrionales bacterium]